MIEWVIPRCETISAESLSQNVVMKSISGTLCAIAPSNIAFLPSLFPAIASPIQAPKTICVSESNTCQYYNGIQGACYLYAENAMNVG